MKLDCPLCGADSSADLVNQEETVIYKNRTVKYEAQFYKCEECKREFDDMMTGQQNLDKAKKKYKEMEEQSQSSS